jgi:hypothetical protein
MSLQPCRECGKMVSSEASQCPHCGIAVPNREEAERNKRALWGCFAAIVIVPVLLLGYCEYATRDLFNPSPGATTTATANRVSPERFAAVQSALEATPGVRVERDPQAPRTMRIHLSRLDVPAHEARQLARMAQSRLGDDAIVYVYDASGMRLARATVYGVE